MLNEIICAGFGGQGVLTAGKIIMYVAYKAEKKITWFPSYGNEMGRKCKLQCCCK